MKTCETQQAYLTLLRHGGGHNHLNGQDAADDLTAHRDLWDKFIYGWLFGDRMFLALRDMPDCGGDMLYIVTTKPRLEKLLDLIRRWQPSELHYMTAEDRTTWKGVPGGNKDMGVNPEFDCSRHVRPYDDQVVIRVYWG